MIAHAHRLVPVLIALGVLGCELGEEDIVVDGATGAIVREDIPKRPPLNSNNLTGMPVPILGADLQGVSTSVYLPGVGSFAVSVAGTTLQGMTYGDYIFDGRGKGWRLWRPTDHCFYYAGTWQCSYTTGLVGATMTATLRNGSTVTIKLRSATLDTTTNDFVNVADRANSDVWLYLFDFQVPGAGSWSALCPHWDRASGTWLDEEYATALAGTVDAAGTLTDSASQFSLTCSNGVMSKCVRQWGYKPFKSAVAPSDGVSRSLRPLFGACLDAGVADYCGNGGTATWASTPVNMWDRYGYVRKMAENVSSAATKWPLGETDMLVPEAAWDGNGGFCLGNLRYDGKLGSAAQVSSACAAAGRPTTVAGPSAAQRTACAASSSRTALVYTEINGPTAAGPSSCSHPDYRSGVTSWLAPLHRECNSCTQTVCTTGGAGYGPDPYCCDTGWDSYCAMEAAAECSGWRQGTVTPLP